MPAITHGLFELTAADLMSRDLTTIPEKMPLRGAARLLRRAGVSGAPVVDARGRCVGVLSATDFLRRAEDEDHPHHSGLHSEWEVIEVAEVGADDVRTYMTRDLVKAAPDAGVGELARMMLDAHVHRVVVVDPEDRPVGIVTSTDILAAVARMVPLL